MLLLRKYIQCHKLGKYRRDPLLRAIKRFVLRVTWQVPFSDDLSYFDLYLSDVSNKKTLGWAHLPLLLRFFFSASLASFLAVQAAQKYCPVILLGFISTQRPWNHSIVKELYKVVAGAEEKKSTLTTVASDHKLFAIITFATNTIFFFFLFLVVHIRKSSMSMILVVFAERIRRQRWRIRQLQRYIRVG